MSWFDKVTGTNDYERQSWRDSYNNGRAAGDITGNVNARLDQERSDFQGATWSGSSSEYSAIELAQRSTTPKQIAEIRGAAAGSSATAVAGVAQDGVPDAPASAVARSTAKGQLVSSVLRMSAASGVSKGLLGNELAYKPMSWALEGYDVQANPHMSNAEDLETRYGDLVSAIAGVGIIGSDIGHNAARAYFGEGYTKLTPGQRLSVISKDIDAGVRTGAAAAIFGGYDALQSWASDNKARENAAAAASRVFDSAWDYREQEQSREALKIGQGSRSGGL